MSLIRQACKPILIIDPDPLPLYLRIEAAIKRKNIYTIPFEWNCVSEFITSGRYKATINNSNGDFNKLINEFYRFEYLLKT
jgi:hypothetical protein